MRTTPLEAGPAEAVPRLPRVYVPRYRLWEQLDTTSDAAIRLLVAPVGAGKTLGVGGWIRASGLQDDVRWISGHHSWTTSRLGDLLDEPGRDATPRFVVVDDAQLLPHSSLRMIDERLRTAPEQLRMLLLSRYDLPFSRLGPELLGHLAFIRGGVLRMDDAEARTLIAEHARTEQPEVVDAITRHAHGWSAAVVLTARAVAASNNPSDAAKRFAEGDTTIAGRLSREVFAALQPRERHLLLCTAGEEQITTETAVHLSNDEGAAEILAELEGTGLLVSRLPQGWRPPLRPHVPPQRGVEPPQYFRIHPLLAEIVKRQLSAGGVDVVQAQGAVRQAVQRDIAADRPEVAFRRLVATRQPEAAAEVLAEHGTAMLARGDVEGVAGFAHAHAEVIQQQPLTWFSLALDRWMHNDASGAGHWLDLIVTQDIGSRSPERSVEHALVRLYRAPLGAEAPGPAIGHARKVFLAHVENPKPQPLLPLLAAKLGYAQTWAGDLAEAEVNLATAISLCRARGYTSLCATALSDLALTLLMQGREHAATEAAAEALDLLTGVSRASVAVSTRCELVLNLTRLADAPRTPGSTGYRRTIAQERREAALHAFDPLAYFWTRVRDARRALGAGSVSEGEQALAMLAGSPTLSEHMRALLLVEQGLLASLAGDEQVLATLEEELEGLGARGEAALLRGMHHELTGDRAAAAAAYVVAQEDATYAQPATRAYALACHAQLADVLEGRETSLHLLKEAVTITDVRRNARPFLGWSRQGTPIANLLGALREESPTPWTTELAAMAHDLPDITSALAPVTATPRERSSAGDHVVRPSLTAREREVLNELARGATYADIAASLFVSENTVKTHVSSLYGKLAVNRRSEALAVARNQHLL